MQSIHNFVRRHHILGSIITVAVFWLVMILASISLALVFPNLAQKQSYVLQAMAELITAAAGFGLCALFGYFRIWRARGSGFGKGLIAGGYFIFISLYSLIIYAWELIAGSGIDYVAPAYEIFFFIVTMFLVGFTEEVFFRGIVANLFLDKLPRNKYGVWSAVIGSGMVFGLLHLGNAIGMTEVGGVLVQVFVASAMGMALSAIYFRTRNIWSVIFIHAFVDFCALIIPTAFSTDTISDTIGSYSAAQFIGIVPYIIVCLVLLRKSKMDTICPFPEPEMRALSEAASKKTFKKYLGIAVCIGIVIIAVYFLASI